MRIFSRSRAYVKRGGHARKVSLDEAPVMSPGASPDLVKLDEALNALGELDARKTRAWSCGLSFSKPRMLFRKSGHSARATVTRGYDLSLDGQRFLMVKEEQRQPMPVTEMTLVTNWLEELRRLVPMGK